MISIVTGVLDRKHTLEGLIGNTIDAWDKLELILVDGGSTDGTVEFIKKLDHPRIKLIEVGHRSPYWHFMNIGIRNASYEYVCQWNDDVILVNNWRDVFEEVKDCDASLFSWQYGDLQEHFPDNWNLCCDFGGTEKVPNCGNDIVMNYGIYKKDVFRKVGLYNNAYYYYYADADMSFRAWAFGFKVQPFHSIKVVSLLSERGNKKALHGHNDLSIYVSCLNMYRNKVLPENLEYIQ